MRQTLFLAILLPFLAASSAQAWPKAFVTIAPQKYFVNRISGGHVPVSIMVPASANPHTYEPKPRQMTDLAQATVYFAIDDVFDQTWLERLRGANPNISVVHTSAEITKMPMNAEHGHTHEADQANSLDPHIWLSPRLVKIQAAHIRDAFIRLDPVHATEYAANTAAFLQEIDALDQDIRTLLTPIAPTKRTFLVFHPSWGYFARDYGLTQVAVEVDGREPGPRELARVIDMGKKTRTRVLFIQPQFSRKSAALIARQIKAQVIVLDPLAENWADNLRQAAHNLATALQ